MAFKLCYVLKKLILIPRTPKASNVIGHSGKYMFPFAVSLFPNTYRRYIFLRRQYMVINFPYIVFPRPFKPQKNHIYRITRIQVGPEVATPQAINQMRRCATEHRNVRRNKKKTPPQKRRNF